MLLAAGVDVCGVVVPAEKEGDGAPIARLQKRPPVSQLPLRTPYLSQSVMHVAWAHDIAVWALRHPGHPQTAATLAALRPDVACVVCFPYRIPATLLALPPQGFLNLHPSLLPAYRGPEPLFWIFREGEPETGVTLHFMDEGLDTGDIVLQTAVSFADGISGTAAARLCGERGGALLVAALQRLQAGTLPRRPQGAGGSYYGRPTAADFHLSTNWPARRAFNFMRGTAAWGQPYPVEVAGERVVLETAVSYHPTQAMPRPLRRNGREASIQFTPGVLRAFLKV